MTPKQITPKGYLAGIANQLVHELEPILKIKEVTQNSELLGSYTEAAVRRLIRRVVHPMRVSTGAVIDFPMPEKLRQVDVIVWAPFPAPSIFEVDDFGLVPRSSAFGLMEIKRSNYTSVDKELEEFNKIAPELTGFPHAGGIDNRPKAMGIICVLDKKPSKRLQAQFQNDTAVAIFDNQSSHAMVRAPDVLKLINFLHYISWCYRMHATQSNYPQLQTTE